MGVFAVTGITSVFAYLWLIIILQISSPDYIDVWEAAVTFAMFPVLVLVAYFFDIGLPQKVLPPPPLVWSMPRSVLCFGRTKARAFDVASLFLGGGLFMGS